MAAVSATEFCSSAENQFCDRKRFLGAIVRHVIDAPNLDSLFRYAVHSNVPQGQKQKLTRSFNAARSTHIGASLKARIF
jgi:hypothetical protein